MKENEKLTDALGMVDEELVVRADRPPKTKKHKKLIKWTSAIAAILVVAIAITLLFDSGVTPSLTVHAGYEAEYPKMAPYPQTMGEYIPALYDNWNADQKKQQAYFKDAGDLDHFISETVPAILGNAEGQNRVYSPLNVYMALAMLAETTDGHTRFEILRVLDTLSMDKLRKKAKAVWNANYNDDGAVTSLLASSLWLRDGMLYNNDTLKTLAETYYASSYRGKMGSASYDKAYRAWLSKNTGGLLNDYIEDKKLPADTVLAIATTVLFQAKWEREFSSKNNVTDIFHGTDGDQNVTYMKTTDYYGRYYWGEKFSASSLGLTESGSMFFILPDEGVTVDELLKDKEALSFIATGGQTKNNQTIKVHYTIPKFDVSSELQLNEALQSLGIRSVFTNDADFSPLGEETPEGTYLSTVNHGARVTIDEEGVTAVAFTEMMYAGAAPPPEEEIYFTVDRPFIFVITGECGTPLFVGVVNNV